MGNQERPGDRQHGATGNTGGHTGLAHLLQAARGGAAEVVQVNVVVTAGQAHLIVELDHCVVRVAVADNGADLAGAFGVHRNDRGTGATTVTCGDTHLVSGLIVANHTQGADVVAHVDRHGRPSQNAGRRGTLSLRNARRGEVVTRNAVRSGLAGGLQECICGTSGRGCSLWRGEGRAENGGGGQCHACHQGSEATTDGATKGAPSWGLSGYRCGFHKPNPSAEAGIHMRHRGNNLDKVTPAPPPPFLRCRLADG